MLKRIVLFLIVFYQKCLRQGLPPSCRFTPSCSEYAKISIEKYGVIKGLMKGVKRVSLCHPFSGKNGYDPVD